MHTSTVIETSNRAADGAAQAFAALGDPVRLAILQLLQDGSTCACELAPQLQIAPNLLSYHIRILREAGLVQGERRGRRIEYRVRPAALAELAVMVIGFAIGGHEHAG